MRNYQQIDRWLEAHSITLEEGFVEAIRMLARQYQKKQMET